MHEVTAQTVDGLHNNIIATIQQVTGNLFQILPGNNFHNWRTAPAETNISFELAPSDNTLTVTDYEYIDRNRGPRTFVFRLFEQEYDEDGIWAGWYEAWRKNDGDSFRSPNRKRCL